MGDTFAKDVTEIAALLIGLAMASMLVKNSSKSGQLISTVANAYGGLIRSATLSDNTVSNQFMSV